MIRSVSAAMCASSVVGDDEKNGGLWCSPIANTSSPTSSAFWAMRTIESIRSASLGVWPLTAFLVMSLTEKIPNCIGGPFALPEYLYDCACSIHDCASISHGGGVVPPDSRPRGDQTTANSRYSAAIGSVGKRLSKRH